VICDRCRKPVASHDMGYQLNYDPQDFGVPEVTGPVAPAGRRRG
jgi:hypothetical protein